MSNTKYKFHDDLKCEGCKKPECCTRHVIHVLGLDEPKTLKLCPVCYKKYIKGTWAVLEALGVDTSKFKKKDLDYDPDKLPF
jgi:hypothetical protein